MNVVDCKWIFKIKRNAAGEIKKYKACLVAKGYSQVQGIEKVVYSVGGCYLR